MTSLQTSDELLTPRFEELRQELSDLPERSAAFLWPGSQVGEALRAVSARLKTGPMAALIRTLAVTSCGAGEGKTCIALGLGAAFAQAGYRTLVVDADLRRRNAAQMLGIEPARGLAEWLEGTTTSVPLLHTEPTGFHFLGAGVEPCRPELLGSARLVRLLATLESRFDRIVLDCAPVLPVADTVALADRVGGFLLVVRSQRTHREALARVAALLGIDRLLGLVLNDYVDALPGRHSPYGYGGGYGDYGSPPRSK